MKEVNAMTQRCKVHKGSDALVPDISFVFMLLCVVVLYFFPVICYAQSSQFERAVELQQLGKFDEAAAQYRELIKINPEHAEAHANLGVVLSRLGKYKNAITEYETTLRINPNLKQLYFNIAVAHYKASNFDLCVVALKNHLQAYPLSTQSRLLLGISLVEMRRDEEAVKELESNIAATSQDVAAMYSLGLAYLRLNRSELKSVLDKLNGTPPGYLLKGQSLIVSREYEQALEEFKLAEQSQTQLPRLYYSKGLALYQLGRTSDALAAFEKESVKDPITVYYLALLMDIEGKSEQALSLLKDLLNQYSDSPEANQLFGKILFNQGKIAESLPPLEKARSLKPDDSELRLLLAKAYQKAGRKEDAAREFAEVKKLKAAQLKNDRETLTKP